MSDESIGSSERRGPSNPGVAPSMMRKEPALLFVPDVENPFLTQI